MKRLVLAPVMVFLMLGFHTRLAIPGPVPPPKVDFAKLRHDLAVLKAEGIAAEKEASRANKMTGILARYHTGLHEREDQKLIAFITTESQKYGFEPELILALISTESSFYNWSVSNKGALGMMQIVPGTGKALAEAVKITWPADGKRLFDPYVNIRLGIHYLHSLKKRFGDLDTALVAYNVGPTKVRRWIRRGQHLPKRYANKVMQAYRSYRLTEDLQSL